MNTFRRSPFWQQEICRQVRDLVYAVDPEVTETIKRTNQPYFMLHGNICTLLGEKDHLNIFIYDPIVPDPEGIMNQGQGNLTARAIQILQARNLNQGALLNLFQVIIANNRAGGWRKLKGNQKRPADGVEEIQHTGRWSARPKGCFPSFVARIALGHFSHKYH